MAVSVGKRPDPSLRDVLISTSPSEQRRLQRAAKAGAITRIANGVYINAVDLADQSPDTLGPVALTVRRNWQAIAGHLVPGAVVSHLSAFLAGLTPDAEITLTHPTRFNTSIALPSLKIVLIKGPGRLPGDMQLGGTGLYWASRARWLLENLRKSRSARPRTAGKMRVEAKLVETLNASGEDALNRVRDDARGIADQLDAQAEFDTLDSLVGALLGTYAQGTHTTRAGVLVANGTPIDAGRLNRFAILANYLRTTSVPDFPEVAGRDPARTYFAFLESYFSNFVEGTRFSIEEAEDIALRNKIVPNRPKDSHDILGVFHLILNPHFRSGPPAPNDILERLRERHRIMLERRPEATPGEFKEQTNYAGQTQFVDPGFVRGTLLGGAQLASSVPEGLARAMFYAFLVSEVHPFTDGNGRLSRLLMNSELSRCARCRIIIPTLYHEQYVDAQRALTRYNDPEPFVRALGHIAKWTTLFDYQDLQLVEQALKKVHAFEENPREFRLLTPAGEVFA
jgi:fido (protein-threonine AMPylation protein)